MIKAKATFLEDHKMPKSYWRQILSEWVGARDADIFDRAYLEKETYEQIAAEFALTERQIKNICQDIEKRIVEIHCM